MRVIRYLVPAALVIVLAAHVSTAARAATSIYKCELAGVLTFSDRPCGTDAARLDQAAMNTYEAPQLASVPKQSIKAPAKKPVSVRDEPDKIQRAEIKRAESCARFARNLKEIRAKMRSGYSAKEGERLRLRQDKVRDSQRAARCG
jgi:hypothetical protein